MLTPEDNLANRVFELRDEIEHELDVIQHQIGVKPARYIET